MSQHDEDELEDGTTHTFASPGGFRGIAERVGLLARREIAIAGHAPTNFHQVRLEREVVSVSRPQPPATHSLPLPQVHRVLHLRGQPVARQRKRRRADAVGEGARATKPLRVRPLVPRRRPAPVGDGIWLPLVLHVITGRRRGTQRDFMAASKRLSPQQTPPPAPPPDLHTKPVSLSRWARLTFTTPLVHEGPHRVALTRLAASPCAPNPQHVIFSSPGACRAGEICVAGSKAREAAPNKVAPGIW